MCESEPGFGFRAFWAVFGCGFRARNLESRFEFKKKGWIRIQENRGGFGFS